MRTPQPSDPLTPLVRRYFEQMPGAGAPSDVAHLAHSGWRRGTAGTAAQGAVVVVYLRLDGRGRVAAMRYQAWGCPHTLAALAYLSGHWVGRTPADPPDGGPQGWAQALALPAEKLGRLLLIEDAIARCA